MIEIPPTFEPILGPLCALGSSITWAGASTIYAQTAAEIGALRTNFLRCLLVLPLFVLSALWLSGPAALFSVPTPQLGWLVLSTICSYVVGDLVFYLAAQRLGIPTALAIASIYPLWAALFGVLSLGERVGPLRAGGTIACIAGVAWLVRQQGPARVSAHQPAGRRWPWLPGVGLALLASLFWAGNSYSIRRGTVGISLLVANSLRFSLSTLTLGLSDWLGRRFGRQQPTVRRPLNQIPRRFYIAAILESYGGSSIFVYGLAHSDLSVAAPLSSLAPLFSVPIGLIMGTESVSLRRLAAIALTVAGLILLMQK
jgi:drug/metabolite transporter (DMT)-like permease